MKTLFLVVAGVVGFGSVVPYMLDIVKGKTKPNLVSWITWTLLTGIATAAAISAHEYVAAIFTAIATSATAMVVAVGLKHGYVKYTYFDITCQFAAVVGIVLWQIFNSPSLGVVSAVVIDFVGALPTFRHAWRHPEEETWQAFAWSGLAACFALLAMTHYNWTTLPYAIYLILVNPALAIEIVYRRNRA